MSRLDGAVKCPHCGYDNDAAAAGAVYHLPPGTVLNGRYIIGKVLGEGGFGITYIGMDSTLSKRVAVKEYFPSGIAFRDSRTSCDVTVSQKTEALFSRGVNRSLFEAKSVAAFSDEEGIVDVQDCFQSNRTAYIVMDYLEGETLKEYVVRHGKFPFDALVTLMIPVMHALREMHKKGIIHRDISPDNIMYTVKGRLKLMDFGSARDTSNENKQKTIILKDGFAPEEQYRSNSEQGPFTDVYALCATIYACVTGQSPVSSQQRVAEDTLLPPSLLGADIRPSQEKALMHGLAVKAADRTPDMDALMSELKPSVSPQAARKAMPAPVPLKASEKMEPPASPNEYMNALRQRENGEPPTRSFRKTLMKKARASKATFIVLAVAGAAALTLMIAGIVFLIVNAGRGQENTQPATKPSEPSSSLNINELLSGLDTKPDFTIPERSSSSNSRSSGSWSSKSSSESFTEAPRTPITPEQAAADSEFFKQFFFDNVYGNDNQARFGATISLQSITYCISKANRDNAYIAFLYHNETAGYYRVMYSYANNFYYDGTQPQSRSSYLMATDPAQTQSQAIDNCWLLKPVLNSLFDKTTIF